MLIKALLVGLLCTITGACEFLSWTVQMQPFVAGSIVGLILGDWKTGVEISATIQLIYMGQIQVGGVSAYDFNYAGVIAPAIAIVGKMTPQMATTVAITVGSLGLGPSNLWMSVNAAWVHMADKYAEKGETKNLWIYNWLLPFLTESVLYGLPAFLAVYYGSEYLEGLISKLPAWLDGGLTAVGTLLPALGIGMMFKAVYNKKFVAFAILGYILAGYFGLTTIGIALFALACVLIYWNLNMKKEA